VRIEDVGEPARRPVHQIGLVDVLDVVVLDVGEHLAEDGQFPVGVEPPRRERPRRQQPAGERAERQQEDLQPSETPHGCEL
jgi:hypothetical protein